MSLKVYSCPHGCNRGATFARYAISANKLNAPAAEVIVNGHSAGVLAFAPYTLDVTPFLTDGENTVSPVRGAPQAVWGKQRGRAAHILRWFLSLRHLTYSVYAL